MRTTSRHGFGIVATSADADADCGTMVSASPIGIHISKECRGYRMLNQIKNNNFKFIYNWKVIFYSLKFIIFIHFIPFSFLYFILRFSHISYIG